ncbi:MAG: isochorismate synthase [Proteobacteria bacterium]|nr:isochorismate synthase [Pseudomonadota bacterium]
MSEEDFSRARTTSAAALAQESWRWELLTIKGQSFVKASIEILDYSRPEAVLRLPRDWAFIWKSKDLRDWQAAWGALLKLNRHEIQDIASDPALTIFGGFPFAEHPAGEAEWGEFFEEHWFIPRCHWRQTGNLATIEILSHLSEPDLNVQLKVKLIGEGLTFIHAMRAYASYLGAPLEPFYSSQTIPDRARWECLVEKAQAAMAADVFAKVVLSRRVDLHFHSDLIAADLFRDLIQLDEESFLFACQSPSGRVFMGRSPERLLAWQGADFQLDAIAGTRRRSTSLSGDQAFARDMQESAKEQYEHRLVGLAIAKVLEQEKIPFERLDKEQIIRLQHVLHMRSRFTGHVPETKHAIELLSLLHPTPAVGGYPRRKAIEFLSEMEDFARGWFAGGIGVLQGDRGDFAIGIRSALVTADRISVYAGAGIVPGSIAEDEWQEIDVKMQNFLGLVTSELGHSPNASRVIDHFTL